MTDIYSRFRPARSQNASLKVNLSNKDGVDLSAAPMAQDVALTATPSLSLAITTDTAMDAQVKSEPNLKLEEDASPSQSPTLVTDVAAQDFKSSCSPSEIPSVLDGTPSSSSTPPPRTISKTSRKGISLAVQLIGDLPIAREEAVRTFNEIHDNNYQYKTLGRSRELLESMTCDCIYEHGVDSADVACGPYSDCINRLTQVECLEDDCRCRKYCQNQRFQRKEYANIEIVLTEKKGYGLRAEEDLPKDTFIYEYVGDVVNPISFKKRMREYAEEGIRHFYFMMLQKDEFIDATKSGGIGRFANHSCSPNCYVAKWTIGTHVRMGIFAKRNIQKHEELTFNYNVDRYGHQAQECFCGEPMCVGYIGGKTQTDIATMDDLYLDALGITDEDDLMELKGTKKKKGKKIDDPDFMPVVKSITEKEVPKVIQAVMQTSSRKVLSKLLTRIKITDDQAALRQIMRLRGYSLMTCILQEWSADLELVTLALECMKTWPLLNRNKVQDSKVHVPVESCAALEDEMVKTLAQSLLDHWATLPTYNRIPKRAVTENERIDVITPIAIAHDPRVRAPLPADSEDDYRRKQRRIHGAYGGSPNKVNQQAILAFALEKERMALERERFALERQEKETSEEKQRHMQQQLESLEKLWAQDASAKAIIAQVTAAAAAEEASSAAAATEAKKKSEQSAEKVESSRDRTARKKTITPEEKEKNKAKRLMKLVGAVVVKCMSKHSKQFDRETFKQHAKELTQIISDKEKKSSSYRDNKLDSLSEEKEAKIKKFAKEYIAKVIRKMEKSKRPQGSTSLSASTANNTPSTSITTPNSNDGGDSRNQDTAMSVEEAMGMELHSDSEAGDDEVADDAEDKVLTNSSTAMLPPKLPSRTLDHFEGDDSMEVDDILTVSLDPRRRNYIDIH